MMHSWQSRALPEPLQRALDQLGITVVRGEGGVVQTPWGPAVLDPALPYELLRGEEGRPMGHTIARRAVLLDQAPEGARILPLNVWRFSQLGDEERMAWARQWLAAAGTESPSGSGG